MSATAIIKIIIQFGPELIKLIQFIYEQVESGIDEIQIRKKINNIHGALELEDRQEAAKRIRRMFNGKGNE